MVECDCGERLILSAFETVCRCGTDHGTLVQEQLASRRSFEEGLHPWDDEYHEWHPKQDEHLRTEYNDWLEWTVIQ